MTVNFEFPPIFDFLTRLQDESIAGHSIILLSTASSTAIEFAFEETEKPLLIYSVNHNIDKKNRERNLSAHLNQEDQLCH